MNHGLLLEPTDHRDYDFHKTFGSTFYDTNTLPNHYTADAGLTTPDQNADGFPMGCTGYTQTDLCTDQDGAVYDAGEFYLSTPPGGLDGRFIRASLKLLTNRGPRTKDGTAGAPRDAFYNIRATGILDWFDAIRVALWITQHEKRSASIAIPWFWGGEPPMVLTEPAAYDWKLAGGHNAKISGWTDIKTNGGLINGGELFLIVKWWGGKRGDNGYVYMSRTIANNIFSMNYTEAFTVSKKADGVQTVDMGIIERLVGFIRSLLGLVPAPVSVPMAIIETTITQSTPQPTLTELCGAMRDFEGKPGDANYINNNPLNCKFYEGGYLLKYGNVRRSPAGFAIFPTYGIGWDYGFNMLKNKIKNHPQWTLYDLIENHAPASDENPVLNYTTTVAKRLGVDIHYSMSNLVLV
jgi:hypothetical protein